MQFTPNFNVNRKTIAAFDFDGTIINRDSLPLFILFSTNLKRLIFSSIKLLPYLILFKLKIIPNHIAKAKLCKYFFSGYESGEFDLLGQKFSATIEKILNPDAMSKIRWHQQMGHDVIIISASLENWIKPWAINHHIKDVLATKMEIADNVLTGKLLSKNCHGVEKVKRLLESYPDRANYTLYSYGDTGGDSELLSISDFPFYRCFK
jgi:phosphatidylglycerophosphatase C